MTSTHKFGSFLVVLFLCIGMFLVSQTGASEPKPSPADLQNLENIKANQKVIEETREAHERFMAAKLWNVEEVRQLESNGWCPVWTENPDDITLAPCKAVEVVHSAAYDLDKLAKAVAMHETKDCGVNVGSALVNNCFGIRGWHKDGTPYFKKYATKEDSYKDFKRIWSTYYGKFPDTALARKYSGNDRPQSWLANVTHYYETL